MVARCRFCRTVLEHAFVDLGTSPPCETLVSRAGLSRPECFYPLHVWVCHECFLVQLEEIIGPEEIFGTGDYPYFSSYSDSWLAHARDHCHQMIERLSLDHSSRVVEIASNDGYLLQYFHELQIPVLGVEPASNCAAVAIERGIETAIEFFGCQSAQTLRERYGPADLMIANNVLAHVPDINDFVGGFKILLAREGTATIEFPSLANLIQHSQFDTIYHEHYSYLSLSTTRLIMSHHGLAVVDVQEVPTHGGSLRLFVCHADRGLPVSDAVEDLCEQETAMGLNRIDFYQNFGQQVQRVKRDLLEFLIDARRQGKRVAGYGAPGKGNTLLNYCGIRTDLLAYTVDRNPHKHGMFTPGARIPIYPPEHIDQTTPDYVLVLPWNLKDEIMRQMQHIRDWGGQFVTAIPKLEVV